MNKLITIKEIKERKTYISGRFEGKYIGYLDTQKSDRVHENFYTIEIISGEIFTSPETGRINTWEAGEPKDFLNLEHFPIKFPSILNVTIQKVDGSYSYYQITLHQPKFQSFDLCNQTYEKDKIFGDINGIISGFILHYDEEEILVEAANGIQTSKQKTFKKTGNYEKSAGYVRYEYYYSDGSTYWDKWEKREIASNNGFWKIVSWLINLLILLLVFIPIIYFGWRLILPILMLIGIIYLISLFALVIKGLLSGLVRIIGVAIALFMIIGILAIISQTLLNLGDQKVNEHLQEKVKTKTFDPQYEDTIISHLRIWEDYDHKQYSATIKVVATDYKKANFHRNQISSKSNNVQPYNSVVSQMHDFERNRLVLLYNMFDSLRLCYKMTDILFAKVITSCIQDIPYTLILPSACNPRLYNDDFITTFLNKGGNCIGNIKYGIFSPSEFMGNLSGDCDTRALTLYTILNHYKYDVVMLASDVYRHAILGVNLPLEGTSIIINNKRYVLWETTQQGVSPGIISPEYKDLKYWSTVLISSNNYLK